MSINLYPDEVHQAQLGEPEYTPEIDEACNQIYKATKGLGTDEKALIAALASKNTVERSLIAYRYKEIYDEDLKELMKKENSGDFGFLTELLSLSAIDAEAKIVRKATKGLGTKEELLYSVICGRSNAEIEMLKKAYFKRYNKDLSNLISSELGGDLKKLALACLQGMEEDYDPAYHTESKAKEDAKSFYKKGQGKKLGTDEAALFEIICKSPPQFLKMIDSAYVDQYNNNMERALEKCLHGKCEKAAIFTLGMKLKPYETVAALIKSRCAGIGTYELGLSCDVLRYQNILQKVQVAHVDLFGKTIGDRIMHETSGDYEKLLLQIVRVAWPDTPQVGGECVGQSSELAQMIADIKISSGSATYHRAAQEGDLATLRGAVDDGFVDLLYVADSNGWTVLHEAVRAGHVDVIAYLVEVGLDVLQAEGNGITPLELAIEFHGDGHPVTNFIQQTLQKQDK